MREECEDRPLTITGAIDEAGQAGPGGSSRESERITSASFLVER